jgi:Alternative splicing regulator
MGDKTMAIDRFDVRGLLSDLSQHEAKNVEANLKMSDYLSPEDLLVLKIHF